MSDFYNQFAQTYMTGGGNPQMQAMMKATAANPGQPWTWQQYDSINGMTVEQALATGKINQVRAPGIEQDNWMYNNPAYSQFASSDMFGANHELGGDTRGRMWGVGADGRLVDAGLSETSQWGALNSFLGTALLAGGGAALLGGGGTAGAAAAPHGVELAGGWGTAAGGAGAAGAAGAATAGSGPISVGGAGGLPAQAAAGGLGGLFGGDTAGLLRNLIGGAGAAYDAYQGYKDAGEMRDWLTGQTPNFEFYQDKLKQSYEDPSSYWKGADFNAGFDVLHNKLQRNDAAGGRLAADAGRQSELQKYTLDSLNNYRSGLEGVVNNQTRARLGGNEAFMQNQANRRDAISPITTFLGNILAGQ